MQVKYSQHHCSPVSPKQF